MKVSKFLTTLAICTLGGFSFCALVAQEYRVSSNYVASDWFISGTPIQELRERSTNLFELLDENNSGSITLEEIYLSDMESDLEEMKPEELRQYSRRSSVINSKFLNWSVEFDEFEVVDTNGDGVWNKDEYEVRGQKLHRHRLELGFEEWDTDENDAIELHEFNSHLDELELLDEDADGTVSHKEAFKSKNDKVISDVVLNKLKFDEEVWAKYEAEAVDLQAEAEVKAKYMYIKQKEADDVKK